MLKLKTAEFEKKKKSFMVLSLIGTQKDSNHCHITNDRPMETGRPRLSSTVFCVFPEEWAELHRNYQGLFVLESVEPFYKCIGIEFS